MNLIQDTFKNFFGLVEGKFVIASIAMIIIFLIICYLLFLVITSFQNRRDAVGVRLPEIDARGVAVTNESSFQDNSDLSIELIDAAEDEASDTSATTDDKQFLTALTMAAGQYISDENHNSEDVKMPEVGEINYEQIKEDKAQAKHREHQEHLRELAKADSEEGLENKFVFEEDNSDSEDVSEDLK